MLAAIINVKFFALVKYMRSLFATWSKELRFPFFVGLFCAMLMAVYSVFLPNTYRSEIRLLPVELKGSGGLGQFAAAAAGLGVGLPGQDAGDANQIDILKSRWLNEQLLLTRFKFREKTWLLGSEVVRDERLIDYLHCKNLDRGMGAIGGCLYATKDSKSKLLLLVAETKSPELSQSVVQAASRLLRTFYQSNAQTRGGAKAAFANARLAEARVELVAAQENLRIFLDRNRNYISSQDAGVKLMGSQLEMEFRLRQQLVTNLAISREQALMEEKNDMPILTTLDLGNLPVEKAGPRRSIYVLTAFALAFTAVLAWQKRRWILDRAFGNEL